MTRLIYVHWFASGLFVAAAITNSIWLAILLAIILILIWNNFMLPILFALIIDSSFVASRELSNLYGLLLTTGAIALTLMLLPLRRFLKL